MKTLKGNISISRGRSTSDDDFVSIRIQDNNSRVVFFEGKLTLEDFAKAILNQGHIPLEFVSRSLGHVGKIKESKELIFSVGPEFMSAKDRATEFCQTHADAGWIADPYFDSQKSIRKHGDGMYYAYGTQHRYVEDKL